MDLLVHICCAPCFAYPHKRLEELGHSVTGYWYNPNIHPTMEYQARKSAVTMYAKLEDVEVVYGKYDLLDYMINAVIAQQNDQRCKACYRYRLEATARYARDRNFDGFTTTMLVSHHQKHNMIRDLGFEAAKANDVSFLYEDFRIGWPQGRAIATQYGLYRQKYCGCLFSELERYENMV